MMPISAAAALALRFDDLAFVFGAFVFGLICDLRSPIRCFSR
jgi:hypothetical protein